jgi:hypothetical protein
MGDPAGAARHVPGAQAGEAAIHQVAEEGGATRFRRIAETPYENVFEARP